MPGVIMDHGSRNGSHTNHDRDQRPNGINGVLPNVDRIQDKGKVRESQIMAPVSSAISNGLNGKFPEGLRHGVGENGDSRTMQARVDRLPEEVAHISESYFPLSTLLARLAQKTHVDLLGTLQELGRMPAPTSAVNGSVSYLSSTDDPSPENVNKKLRLMNFATSSHEAWTKALVITGWSRKAEDVSRLIDLRIHLEAQKRLYTDAVDLMAENKRALQNFRLPNPDIKTALEVLTTGQASWMPDLNYIQPPPLTAKEVMGSLEKLNTLLCVRLNLKDHESIPFQFRDFTIRSGRATFTVPGEFEIDLTIADEESESQYWFIDFRFLFQPSSGNMDPGIRWHLENKVNEILLKDGLSGCYKYLHELILTYKINEFRRQAVTLARSTWIDTLKVEILNRPISIQYWVNRYTDFRNSKGVLVKGSKSWVILGVHSGRRQDSRPDPKATSLLFIRWFRESKEVKDFDITFDTTSISTKSLLESVISRHVEYILTAIYQNLVVKPLFAKGDLELSLHISQDNPAESELKIQLTCEHRLSIKINPISGRFIFSPMCRAFANFEAGLNDRVQDPASEGHMWVERLRLFLITEDLSTRALSVGWNKVGNPELRLDRVQQFAGKDHLAVVWFRRYGWAKDWFLAVSQSMSGEKWHLVKTALVPTTLQSNNREVDCAIKLPIQTSSPRPTYPFLSTLNIFAAGVISHFTNMKILHAKHVHHMLGKGRLSKALILPSVYTRLSDLVPSKNRLPRTGNPWAKDIIRITFQGVEMFSSGFNDSDDLSSPVQSQVMQVPMMSSQPPSIAPQRPFSAGERAVLIAEAQMLVPLPQALLNINDQVDKNVIFNAQTGSFAIRLHSRVGEPVVPVLIDRMVRVERLVEFIQVLHKHEKTLVCEMVSLGKIIFTYRHNPSAPAADVMGVDAAPNVYKVTVDFSATDNIMVLVLEKGNPHLRIADTLAKILNGPEGLDGIATFLPLTLPILSAFDIIEMAWCSDELSARGEAFINVRAADSYLIRYNLVNPSPNVNAILMSRKIEFEVRLRQRKGVPWWYVQRTDSSSRGKGEDTLDEALKHLWNASGLRWQGMRISAVAQGSGTETLLLKLDEVVRNFAMSGKGLNITLSAQASAPDLQKQAPPRQQQPQRQQQSTPNQSQNQSQGRNNAQNREIVEID
ncbi:mediator complex subunit [Cadophora gregata f. sp. sojae]|nr:mediator complex subunit [Cadophora gregata f. sp. sojae]